MKIKEAFQKELMWICVAVAAAAVRQVISEGRIVVMITVGQTEKTASRLKTEYVVKCTINAEVIRTSEERQPLT